MAIFFVQLLAGVMLLILLHVAAMALTGVAFGIELREVSLGFGKELLRWGKVTIRAVPLGGYAKFADTREEWVQPPADTANAYNHQPALVQAIVPLSGCVALVLLATLVLAGASVAEVIAGFRQVIVGAFGPTTTAQDYIQALYAVSTTDGFPAMLAVVATKVAAFNLLPLPMLNGGQALLALVPSNRNDTPDWQLRLMQIAIFPWLAMVGSWGFALYLFARGQP